MPDPSLHAGATPPEVGPAEFYAAESLKIRQHFDLTSDGVGVSAERAGLVDEIISRLYREHIAPGGLESADFCLLAVGGYGRRELFPFSDVDLLFLSTSPRTQAARREGVAAMLRALWDMRLRVGHSSRTLKECFELDRANLEFHVSLLDCRYLAGDVQLFDHLRQEVLPHVVARDRQDLVRDLVEMTRERHSKHGNTIFHLEPNLKDAPGALRDYHLCRWLALVAELDRTARWARPEDLWPLALGEPAVRAFGFLAAARAFVHYRRDRDDNLLTYELQDEAASGGIGLRASTPPKPGDAAGAKTSVSAAEWMRRYFRHARAIEHLSAQMLDDVPGPTLYALFRDWRSRLSTADFSVVRGRIYPRHAAAALESLAPLVDLFEMVARHGLELSREVERWATAALDWIGGRTHELADLWPRLGRLLLLPHAADALRDMHRTGVLTNLFPEFCVVDALVVRDFYHRYTVDEHSFRTIENLHRLAALGATPGSRPRGEAADAGEAVAEWERKLAEILPELEQPELLYLALLFHDVGKGRLGANHVRSSLEALEGILARLDMSPDERETVRFLVEKHLEMSAAVLRRDVFDPETVRAFASIVGTPERLKLLCLLTYADIKAVNPDALTPWRAEMLWQLYVATSNYLARSMDDERIHAATSAVTRASVGAGLPKIERAATLLGGGEVAARVRTFLDGFPNRYLETHAPEAIAAHFRMASDLAAQPVRLKLERRRHAWELTVVTRDRPGLFASLTGTLAAWGMNILKADAFSNAAGIVLDTFRFADLFRTLELNPTEGGRLEENVIDVVTGKLRVETLLAGRVNPAAPPPVKVKIPTQLRFDDDSSSHSSLLELIAQDRPGLLYEVSSTLASLGSNIEVALIDTEGQKVIDVFYLTAGGAKLSPEAKQRIGRALLARL